MLRDAPILINLSSPDLDEAAAFYEGKLGLPLEVRHEMMPGYEELRFAASGATLCLTQGQPAPQTKELVDFRVDDLDATVQALRERGLTFEEYDLPQVKTTEGIASVGAYRAAWFKDPGGNLFGVFEEVSTNET